MISFAVWMKGLLTLAEAEAEGEAHHLLVQQKSQVPKALLVDEVEALEITIIKMVVCIASIWFELIKLKWLQFCFSWLLSKWAVS